MDADHHPSGADVRGPHGRSTDAAGESTNTSAPRAARTLRAEWNRLVSSRHPPGSFDSHQIEGLPEPVRRWLTHALPLGTPLAQSVLLTMRGQIKLGAWRPFTAREVLAPPSGFIWAATARFAGLPVSGFDRYSSDTGEMRWRLLGLIPAMTAAGSDVTRSAAGRLAGEATCWLPTAFAAASWSAGPTPDTAVASWRIGEQTENVQISIAAEGQLRELEMQRWGNPDEQPFARYPFGVAVDGEREFDGITIPSTVRAGWGWGSDQQDEGEFFRAEITEARFS